MNPFKIQVLRLQDDKTVGSSDMPAVWNQRAHEGMSRHPDGLNPSLTEAVRAAALGAGATKKSIDIQSLDRVQAFLMDLPPPKYGFSIDQALASKGQPLFEQHCAECHAFGGARTGKVVPVAEVGTDPHRSRHWTQAAADAFNRFGDGYPWAFRSFRATNGYTARPLDGIWLRAPYLHNGSVPNMRELLSPPEQRSRVFYRGYDVYDQANLGFIASGPEAETVGFRYDTSVTGNSNQGHTYGTGLSGGEKQALIEYMKTF
jgi:mono/diheme cytochrome c family protein